MDTDGDGSISAGEFVRHFDLAMPSEEQVCDDPRMQ